jgi:hypothetical protein
MKKLILILVCASCTKPTDVKSKYYLVDSVDLNSSMNQPYIFNNKMFKANYIFAKLSISYSYIYHKDSLTSYSYFSDRKKFNLDEFYLRSSFIELNERKNIKNVEVKDLEDMITGYEVGLTNSALMEGLGIVFKGDIGENDNISFELIKKNKNLQVIRARLWIYSNNRFDKSQYK